MPEDVVTPDEREARQREAVTRKAARADIHTKRMKAEQERKERQAHRNNLQLERENRVKASEGRKSAALLRKQETEKRRSAAEARHKATEIARTQAADQRRAIVQQQQRVIEDRLEARIKEKEKVIDVINRSLREPSADLASLIKNAKNRWLSIGFSGTKDTELNDAFANILQQAYSASAERRSLGWKMKRFREKIKIKLRLP